MSNLEISSNLQKLFGEIRETAQTVNRDANDIKVVAVTKEHGIDAILRAYEAGHLDFGENKAFELTAKASLAPRVVRWHLLGHWQTNKVKKSIPHIYLAHTLDSDTLAAEINKRASIFAKTVDCLIQICISDDPEKTGMQPEDAAALLQDLEKYPYVRVLGLMGMASNTEDQDLIRAQFRSLRELRDQFKTYEKENVIMRELSMGMTNDFKIAIQEGATILRIGAGIFGDRQ